MQNDEILIKLEGLKKKLKSESEEYMKQKGRLEQLYESLKRETGEDSLEEAKKMLELLSINKQEKKDQIRNEFKEIAEYYGIR